MFPSVSSGNDAMCCNFYLHCAQVPKARRALTIYQKMQIVKYADEVEQNIPTLEKRHPAARARGKVASDQVRWIRKRKKGIDVQALCRLKFGSLLGGIKVCVLRKRARLQKWSLLTEAQQRSMFSLTDEVKQSLKLGADTIKG